MSHTTPVHTSTIHETLYTSIDSYDSTYKDTFGAGLLPAQENIIQEKQ